MISDAIEALIQKRAAEILAEVEVHVDWALVLAGFDSKYINRRRGQIRRFRNSPRRK